MLQIFDPIRNALVAATPEEEVRQKVIEWLIHTKGYPLHTIDVEVSLSRFNPLRSERIDVLVTMFSSNSSKPCFKLVVECKKPGTPLGIDVQLQIQKYLVDVPAEYAMLTNGEQALFFKKCDNRYSIVSHIPDYTHSF